MADFARDDDSEEDDEEKVDENPKYCPRVFFIVVNVFLTLAGMGLLAISIVFLWMFHSFSILFLATCLAGLAGIVVSIFGFIGSQYGKKGHDNKLTFLIVYFTIIFMLSLIVALFAGFCFFFTDSGKTVVILTWKQYEKQFENKELSEDLEERKDEMNETIKKYLTNYYYVGGVAAFLLVVVILGVVFAAILLGMVKLIKFILFIGASSIIIIGALCIIVGVYFIAVYKFAEGMRGLTVAVIVMGGVIILLGIFGVYVGTNFQSHRCMLLFYLIILLLYLVAFVCIGGIFYVLATSTRGQIEKDVTKWCTGRETLELKGEEEGKGKGEGELDAPELKDQFCRKIQDNLRAAYDCVEGVGGGPDGGTEDNSTGGGGGEGENNTEKGEAENGTGEEEEIGICGGLEEVLDFLVKFIQNYFRMIGYACFVFGGFILVNILLVLLCIINPFGPGSDEDEDGEDAEDDSYGKTIEEKDHKNDRKARKVFPE